MHWMRGLEPSTGELRACAQSYRFGSFGNNAPWASAAHDHFRVTVVDPLWRGVPASSLPQPAPAPEAVDTGGAIRPAEQPVQRRRDAPGAPVSDDLGARTDRDGAVAAAEWGLPVPHGTAELSRGFHAAPVPSSPDSQGSPKGARPARSLASPYDDAPEATVPAHLRCRLDRLGRLRPAGAGADRLEPDQAGPPVVSPVALLRGANQGLLAWGAAAGRRPYRQRDARSPGGVLEEDPGRGPLGDCPRRQRVFRSHPGRMARGSEGRLRDRRAADPADQTEVGPPPIRDAQPRRRGRRVPLPAHQVASSVSVRRDPATPARRTDGPVDALQARPVSLPGARHESGPASAQPLALLQRPGRVELLIRQLKTFSGSCQAIFLERCRSCCRAIVARWYDSSYGIWRSHRTKMIFSHFAPNTRSAWRWELPRARSLERSERKAA